MNEVRRPLNRFRGSHGSIPFHNQEIRTQQIRDNKAFMEERASKVAIIEKLYSTIRLDKLKPENRNDPVFIFEGVKLVYEFLVDFDRKRLPETNPHIYNHITQFIYSKEVKETLGSLNELFVSQIEERLPNQTKVEEP